MIEPMAMSIEHHHGMTVAEFERYAKAHPDQRLELIDGEIYTVAAESEPHALTVDRVHNHLRDHHRPPARVHAYGSVRLDDNALWDPDVYVYFPDPERTDHYPHADELELVVEVSLSTADRDLGSKLIAYARNGIPEYWVIDPAPGGTFQRFTDPHPGGYRTVEKTPLPDGFRSLPF